MSDIPIYAARKSARGRREKLGAFTDGRLVLRDRRHGETFEAVLTEDELIRQIDASRSGRDTIPPQF